MAVNAIGNVGARVDLALRQGADFATTLTFTNSDGSTVDLTGCELAAQLRRSPRSPAPADAVFTVAINAPATAGIATMSLPAAASAPLVCGNEPSDPASRYFWDLQLTDAGGLISAPLFGAVTVYPEITR